MHISAVRWRLRTQPPENIISPLSSSHPFSGTSPQRSNRLTLPKIFLQTVPKIGYSFPRPLRDKTIALGSRSPQFRSPRHHATIQLLQTVLVAYPKKGHYLSRQPLPVLQHPETLTTGTCRPPSSSSHTRTSLVPHSYRFHHWPP